MNHVHTDRYLDSRSSKPTHDILSQELRTVHIGGREIQRLGTQSECQLGGNVATEDILPQSGGAQTPTKNRVYTDDAKIIPRTPGSARRPSFIAVPKK